MRSNPPTTPAVRDLTPRELADRFAQGTAPRLIDVREAWEWEICHIPEAELKPLSEIRAWWTELDPAEPSVFQCHSGNRSLQVCLALAAEGFTHLFNLVGGIDAWAVEVAPSMRRY
jgi:rhodanese-related sulfurtransferase